MELCTALAKAISSGDIPESKKLVRELINKNIKAKATLMCEEKICKFTIKIHVESVNMNPTEPISLLVSDPLTTSIRNLKEEVNLCPAPSDLSVYLIIFCSLLDTPTFGRLVLD